MIVVDVLCLLRIFELGGGALFLRLLCRDRVCSCGGYWLLLFSSFLCVLFDRLLKLLRILSLDFC